MPVEAPTQPSEFFGPGIAVEVGKIQRELKKLWQDNDQAATRASRLNLVLYNSGESSIRANTSLVEQIARQHAIRAIIIAAKPQLPGNHVRAWVNAHCQINKNGAKQRCSEQIAFELTGEARQQGLVPNIVLGHLDSDLPLYFWRQGEFSNPSEQLMQWVDRLIFDSTDWPRPAEQFALVRRIIQASDLEPEAIADLNWTRLAGLRFAVAQFFDAPDALASLAALESVEITHGPGAGVRTRALLLVGWLASQLGWQRTGGDASGFHTASGQSVTVKLNVGGAEGEGIRQVGLYAPGEGGDFTVSRDAESDFYRHLRALRQPVRTAPTPAGWAAGNGGARQRGTHPRRRARRVPARAGDRGTGVVNAPPTDGFHHAPSTTRARFPLGGMAAARDGQLRGRSGRAATARADGARTGYFSGSFVRQPGRVPFFADAGCSGSVSRSTRTSKR